ncbi:MAG: excalibur calcium-binding domain-containing protein [Rhodospirillaceae bacterium]|nr:excalibur calcium-binding domain-containing protein [Rhodospirillaceae bacterium]
MLALTGVGIAQSGQALGAETWRGLVIAPEHRCAPYDRDDYPYSPSVEAEIVAAMGGRVYGPYTGRYFLSTRRTDIEHIVAVSEGHDSGLCAADQTVRRRFASDLLNLTLAAPEVNRCSGAGKCAHDAADWLPAVNKCWFVSRVIAVKLKYSLTVDRDEAFALQRVLSDCTTTDIVFTDLEASDPTLLSDLEAPEPTTPSADEPARSAPASDVLALYDDNRNGRITCAEARSHGIAPVPRDHPAYPFMRDGDGDGVVCE